MTGKISLWEIPQGTLLHHWYDKNDKNQKCVVRSLAISQHFIFTANDKLIKGFSYNFQTKEYKLELKWILSVKEQGVNSIRFIDTEPYFVTVTCPNGSGYLVNASTGVIIDSLKQGMNCTPEPIGYKLKEKYEKVMSVEDKKKLIDDLEKANTLFKVKNVPFVEEEEIVGKSNKWGLMMNIEEIKKRMHKVEPHIELPLSYKKASNKVKANIKSSREKEEDIKEKNRAKMARPFMKRNDRKTQGTNNELHLKKKNETMEAYKKLKPKVSLKGKVKQADEMIYILFTEHDF